jgi:uncharacterized protein (DUF1501 family)
MTIDRRTFIKHLSAVPLLGSGLATSCLSQRALAADDSGYRALVCVFLFGGMDNNDVLLPADSQYDDFAFIRQSLLAEQGESRARENLLVLQPDNAGSGDSLWALPPEMSATRSLFESGNASIVSNVGPLIEPISRQQYLDSTAPLPARLFSHNDQQATWQASAPEGAQLGWGGLFADAFLSSSSSSDALSFTTIASTDVGPFLTGERAFPYRVNAGGASRIFLLGDANDGPADDNLQQRLRQHLRGENYRGSHVIRGDMVGAFASALDTNASYNQARSNAASLFTAFPQSGLGSQLRTVAETISIRNELGVSRQVFFVGIGGFDTHSEQAQDLPLLLADIDASVSAFFTATGELGVSDEVTLFTASDFGRTLAVNGDGTDHGWGAHHLVVGGAVRGRQLLGTPPPPRIDNPFDAGAGAAIPQFSVEQFAEPLGQWFGLSDDELLAALPRLGNFDRGTLPLFA